MKKIYLYLVLALGFFAVGCNSPQGEERGGLSKMGTEQGNGMISYSNAKMGVHFEYPKTWKLTESADATSVALDNSPVVRPSELVSTIQFSVSPTVFGAPVKDTTELQRVLLAKWPSRTWQEVSFTSGQRGFSWRGKDEVGKYLGDYFLLDQNFNVLQVSYQAFVDLGGFGVVKSIVGSMTVDFTAPVVEQVYFEPASARPGDTVNLVVRAWDETSEVSVDGLVFQPGDNFVENGGYYNLSDPSFNNGYLAYMVEMGDARFDNRHPFNKNFAKRGENTFIYSFTVPTGASEGVISVPRLYVRDSAGNRVELAIPLSKQSGGRYEYESKYEISVSGLVRVSNEQKPLARPELKISRDGASLPIDSTAPKVARIWFEKTMVSASQDKSQKLFIEVEDASPIREQAHIELGNSAQFRFLTKPLKKEKEGVYSVTFEIDDSRYPLRENIQVGLSRLVVWDEVGNEFFGSADDGALPMAGFILVP